jgi:hypothetical protein
MGACQSTRTSVSVATQPIPVVSALGDQGLSMGNSVALRINSGYASYTNYSWRNGSDQEIGTQSTLTVTQPGNYTVVVTHIAIPGNARSNTFSIAYSPAGQDLNYIATTTVQVPGITTLTVIPYLDANKKTEGTRYFDGLGRLTQSVANQGSPLKKDVVTPVVYDPFGRQVRKYLSFLSGSDGWQKTVSYNSTDGNYSGTAASTYGSSTSKIAVDVRPFSETVFDDSPLNRTQKIYGPGNSWGPNNSNKYIGTQYLVNGHSTSASSVDEKVIAWTIDAAGMPVRADASSGYVEPGGYYSSGQLTIQSVTDEQGFIARKYMNRQGKVVLQKHQVGVSTNLNSTSDWALTYYVYDDYGDLVMVLPPEATKRMIAIFDLEP